MKVIVLGAGVVGKPTAEIVRRAGHKVFLHDPPKNIYAMTDENVWDVCVICTPCEDGMLPDELPQANEYVVRSTVKPEAFRKLSSGHRHHWPEFLTEATAEYDAFHPDKIVWGSDQPEEKARRFACQLLGDHYWVAPRVHCSLVASSLIKLGINAIYTAKVLMANALYDAIWSSDEAMPEEDYNAICLGLALDKRITLSHENVWRDGYRGAGGKCLPKDTRLLAEVLEYTTMGEFVEFMLKTNERLRNAKW